MGKMKIQNYVSMTCLLFVGIVVTTASQSQSTGYKTSECMSKLKEKFLHYMNLMKTQSAVLKEHLFHHGSNLGKHVKNHAGKMHEHGKKLKENFDYHKNQGVDYLKSKYQAYYNKISDNEDKGKEIETRDTEVEPRMTDEEVQKKLQELIEQFSAQFGNMLPEEGEENIAPEVEADGEKEK